MACMVLNTQPTMYAVVLLGSIEYPSRFLFSLTAVLYIVILDLVALTPKPTVSASTVE